MLRFVLMPALCALSICTGFSAVHADTDTDPKWHVSTGVAFTMGELERAIAARTLRPARQLGCASIDVRAESPEQVLVLCDERGQVVELGERSGPDAARRVALVLLDLAEDSLEVEISSEEEAIKPEPPSGVSAPEEVAGRTLPPSTKRASSFARPALPVHTAGGWHVWGRATVGAARGLSGTDALMTTLGAAFDVRFGAFVASLEIHEQRARLLHAVDVSHTLRSAHLGIGAEVSAVRGWLHVGLSSLRADSGAEYASRTPFAGASFEVPVRLTDGLELAPWTMARLFGRRAAFDLAGRTLRTTPRVQVSLGVALRWRFGEA